MAEGWQSVRIDEIEPIPVVDGTPLWRPLRRTLDIGAFGMNAYVAPNAGDDVVEEHTESSLGHEEVYVVLSGRATFTLDDETLDAPAGTVVFIRDVDVRRHARAEEPETSALAIGGPRGAAYEPSAWEDYFAADGIAPPGTTTHIWQSWRRLSTADRITRARCTTSRAPRRWPDGPTTRSRAPATGPRAETGARRAREHRRRLRLVARATRLAGLETHDGVTRYASKTASRLRSAVRSERSSFTSPTSAVYQFRAIPSSTTPP